MYDSIIIGCGPAGMSAAIYLKRAGKNVLVLESETIGGQMASAPFIENYPGFTKISGVELADHMFEQVSNLGIDFEIDEAKKITKGDVITVEGENTSYKAKTLIIATGSKYRTLGLKEEEIYLGKGIHFCVSCDGAFYKDKIVAVIGGANSALSNALMLSQIAKKVYLIYYKDKLKGEKASIEQLESKDNVEILLNTNTLEYYGKDVLEGIKISKDGVESNLKLDGVFLAVGTVPNSALLNGIIDTNDAGYFISEDGLTKESNIFVAGDCRVKKNRQITIAVADGTNAALEAIKYLNSK